MERHQALHIISEILAAVTEMKHAEQERKERMIAGTARTAVTTEYVAATQEEIEQECNHKASLQLLKEKLLVKKYVIEGQPDE